jgi:hypothetical protein
MSPSLQSTPLPQGLDIPVSDWQRTPTTVQRVNRSGSAQSAVPFGSVSPRLPLQPHLRLSPHAATAQRSCFVFAS